MGVVGTRVNVALGGGARGYAHIGVLEVLEERGYAVASAPGTSMGALVGGLYAVGRMRDYAEWARTLTRRDVLRLLDPAFRAVRASITLPSFITPVVIDGRLLADGGLLNPIPVAATAATPAELTIGLVPGFAPAPVGMRAVQVLQLSVEVLQAAVTRFRLAANPPDLLVTVPRGAARALDGAAPPPWP
ncbi:MAG: hypothetical protein EA388_03505 [Nitriliruptor sp.]|nr:MAG: hypothetical protein EA388_03505 [Nitriliruptor sp.]